MQHAFRSWVGLLRAAQPPCRGRRSPCSSPGGCTPSPPPPAQRPSPRRARRSGYTPTSRDPPTATLRSSYARGGIPSLFSFTPAATSAFRAALRAARLSRAIWSTVSRYFDFHASFRFREPHSQVYTVCTDTPSRCATSRANTPRALRYARSFETRRAPFRFRRGISSP